MTTVAVQNTFLNRQKLILIGLTGRTGSGCTTIANILKTKSFNELTLKDPITHGFRDEEERKYKIIYDFMRTNSHWKPFTVIEVSSVILSFVLQNPLDKFISFLSELQKIDDEKELYIANMREIKGDLETLKYMFTEAKKFSNFQLDNNNDDFYNFYINKVVEYKKTLKRALEKYKCVEHNRPRLNDSYDTEYDLYTYLMQLFGNNVRASGDPFCSAFSANALSALLDRLNDIVQVIVSYNEKYNIESTRICIDAIRNPFEARYFYDKYRGFYLFSVNANDKDRRSRLTHLKESQILNLDRIEYPQKHAKPENIFFHQDIQACLDVTDVHIYNPNVTDKRYNGLTQQLVKYIALILHPGLVTPTQVERCMQLAYTCKLNSGCLSRQVGAVITDKNYSVKAVGWNDVPEGQVPCNLRDVCSYAANFDAESYSDFEIHNEKFKASLEKIKEAMKRKEDDLIGLPKPFCFKDVYNSIINSNNQVYTRSLHAEENAFLQLAKYGGQGILGGNLFTTSSPCELCAKKAYHLGIKHIYYIDPYPGISRTHILRFGNDGNPEQHLYSGAIGDAYVSLYDQRMPLKDEITLLSGCNVKQFIGRSPKSLIEKDICNFDFNSVSIRFEFKDRENIVVTNNFDLSSNIDSLDQIDRELYWSGSFMSEPILSDKSKECEISINDHSAKSLCYYTIKFTKPLKKEEKIQFSTIINAKDESHEMQPYFGFNVVNYTKQLEICVAVSKREMIKNVRFNVYADKARKYLTSREDSSESIQETIEGNLIIYKKIIFDPKLFTNYCIEWDF